MSPAYPERAAPSECRGAARLRGAGLGLWGLACAVFAATAARAVPAAVAPATPRIVQVEMTEFQFRPRVILVEAGRTVRLAFANKGRLAHQFETDYLRALPVRVMDESIVAETSGSAFVRLEPGAAASIDFRPHRRGRFAFACTIEGHAEAGMRGILDVR
jgi:uncharacterized cupredoxin-like copper-binding protein